MDLEIITPKGIEFSGIAEKIILPTRSGQIAVLPDHAPLISVLKAGRMKIHTAGKEIEKEIEGGILEVEKKKTVILLKKF
jgi:F-type H+-transporting ATPase subunit epsilon